MEKTGARPRTPLLEVRGLKKHYPIRGGLIPRVTGSVRAVDGVDFEIFRGETLGLVGESGCGKSTVGRQVVALETPSAGRVLFDGEDLAGPRRSGDRSGRTRLQMIFQDSFSSLNPRRHVGDILAAPMLYHGIVGRASAAGEVERLLDMVGLSRDSARRYPHEFSGGQRQRIGIARALSLRPELIVCDEPVSALDVSIQAQILNLFRDIQKELTLSYLFIGHGLAAVNYVSDRVAVMYLGKIVETAPAGELFLSPAHPYARALCDAAPAPDPALRGRRKLLLKGEIPSAADPPAGCRFHPRCPWAQALCSEREPELLPVPGLGRGHRAACHFAGRLGPGSPEGGLKP